MNILMYHSISDNRADYWAVGEADFFRQMAWLTTNHYTVLPLDEMIALIKRRERIRKCVALTFDDGYCDFVDTAVPILQSYGYPATLFVPTNMIGGTSTWERVDIRKRVLGWEALKRVTGLGYTIGAHSLTHRELPKLTREEAIDEIRGPKDVLERELGIRVSAFAYPFGAYTEREVMLARTAGYDLAVTAGSCWGNYHDTDSFCLERISLCQDDSLDAFAAKITFGSKPLRHLRRRVTEALSGLA